MKAKLFASELIRALVWKKSLFLVKVYRSIICSPPIRVVRSKYLISLSLSRKESFTRRCLLPRLSLIFT
jgi:hypothetical protein